MIYPLLRAVAGIALRWYYSGLDVEGAERIPPRAPLLLVVNHPNALVDALVVGWVVPRRVVMTAKSTIFVNRLAAALLDFVGVVPLRRASDEVKRGAVLDPRRNEDAFRAVHHALRRGRAVLIFPEGISHDEPRLAPLRSGAARMALQGAREAGLADLEIVPIGLTFERKEQPRTRVLVQVGEPIVMREWMDAAAHPAALTAEIEARLRALTLNFATGDDAARARALASTFARLLGGVRPVGAPPPLSDEFEITRRIEAARDALERVDAVTRRRVDVLLDRLAAFERRLAHAGIDIAEVDIEPALPAGIRFTVREGWRLLVAGPVALWGTVNHWIPFHAARAIAMREVESAADPAMRTIVAGAVLVLAGYLVQGAVVAALLGPLVALAYLISLPAAADANFLLRERLDRVRRRARAYRAFRNDPAFHRAMREELAWLRGEALALNEQLSPGLTASSDTRGSAGGTPPVAPGQR